MRISDWSADGCSSDRSAQELDVASVCIQTVTTTELNLADFFRLNDMNYEPVPIETQEEAIANYQAGRCDAYTTDASGLAAARSSFDNAKDHIILPEIIRSEEHTSELQSLMRISYAVFFLKKKNKHKQHQYSH